MESGTPGVKRTSDGWMNRLLGELPGKASPTRGLAVGAVLPRIYAGPVPVASMAEGQGATRPTVLDQPRIAGAFGKLYDGDDATSRTFRESLEARREVLASLDPSGEREGADGREQRRAAAERLPRRRRAARAPDAQRPERAARVRRARRLGHARGAGRRARPAREPAARRSAKDSPCSPTASGRCSTTPSSSSCPSSVAPRARTATAAPTTVTATRCGCSAARSPAASVHGRWPGIDDASLHEGRDVAVTTDFRDVFADVAARHLRLSDARLARLFPSYAPRGDAPRVLRAVTSGASPRRPFSILANLVRGATWRCVDVLRLASGADADNAALRRPCIGDGVSETTVRSP